MSNGQKIGQALDPGTAPGVTTTIIVVVLLVGSIVLTYAGKINGDAFVALASTIIGGVLVSRGVASGSQASQAPPPAED
jgi:hypothetical protein